MQSGTLVSGGGIVIVIGCELSKASKLSVEEALL
jgi:hypothetical protein